MSATKATVKITLNVNGSDRSVEVHPMETLLDVLRDRLDLTGPKKGCDETVCGACAVLFGDRSICSCTMLAIEAAGYKITTIEGLAPRSGKELDPVQQAFVEHDAYQCGFCTSGQIISATSFLRGLEKGEVPTDKQIKEAMRGNLCRCGAYNNIVDVIKELVSLRGTAGSG